MALYDIAAGLKPLDLGRTLAQVDAMQANRLQADLAREQAASERTLTEGLRQYGPALAGADPAARQSALQAIAGLGPRGLALALPILQNRQRPMTAAELQAGGFRPGSVVMVNEFTGAPNVLQQPDTLSGDAEAQRIRIAAASRAPQQPQAPVAIMGPDGQPRLVPPAQAYGQRPYLPAENRQPGPGTDAEAEVNVLRLAPLVGQGRASPDQVTQYLSSLNRIQRPRFDAATGQTIVPTIPAFAPSVQDVARLYPNAIYSGAPSQPYDPTQFGPRVGAIPPNAPGSLPVVPGVIPAPSPQPGAAAPPAGAPVQQAPLPAGTVQGPAPGMFAEQPPPRLLPGPGGIEGSRLPSPQAREAVRKAEVEVGKIADAAQNFLRVLNETGGTGINTLLNNPRSPQAQRVLAAFENFKMTMRGEALLNTGVLQPGENVMINDMLLNPQTIRGAMATNDSYAARIQEITNFVLQGYNRQRATVGLPPVDRLPGTSAPPAGGGRTGSPPPPPGFEIVR